MEKSEILVHITAPSGAVDDARYRAQVEAILNFHSHSREIIHQQPSSSSSSSSSSPPPPPPPSPRVPTSLLLSSHPEATASTTVLTPAARNSQLDSLDSPISVIPDSQPQIPEPRFEALNHLSLPSPPAGHHLPGSSFSSSSRVSHPPSSKRCRVNSPPRPPNQETRHRHPSSWRSDKEQHHLSPENHDHDPSSAPELHVNGPPVITEPTQQTPCLASLPMEIHPPLPPISTEHFVTHITPTLAMLAGRLKSSRIYNPIRQSRDLDNLERGYWLLRVTLAPPPPPPPPSSSSSSSLPNPQNPSTHLRPNFNSIDDPSPNHWDMTAFTHFWSFLSDFISKEGRAGWGVWCILDDAPSPDSGAPSPPSHGAPQTHSNVQRVTLKVYAWGEIARHVYLLLFLASERRIRKMGAQWRDGRDEVVIQMP